MTRKNRDFFEFEGIRFFPPKRKLKRLANGKTVFLREKESVFLCVLLENKQQVVSYETLRAEGWDGYYSSVDHNFKHNLQTTKNSLLKTLQNLCDKNWKELIVSQPNEGYCFLPEVTESLVEKEVLENPLADSLPTAEETAENPTESVENNNVTENIGNTKEENPEISAKQIEISVVSQTSSAVSVGHLWFLMTGSFLYAALLVVALLLETAYKFDVYGERALNAAPFVFFWIFITSILTLFFGRRFTRQGQTGIGAAVLLLGFIVAALILHFTLGFVLPTVPVTESNFQTQTAHSAYLKNICYFLPLVFIYLLFPLHFVTAAEREVSRGNNSALTKLLMGDPAGHAPSGSVYLKLPWLVFLLFGAAIYSFFATFNLLDNLKLSPFLDLFTQFLWCRVLLYFALGGLCLVWYSLSLNDLRQWVLNQPGKAENHFAVSEKIGKQEIRFAALVFTGMLIVGGLGFWFLRISTLSSLPHLEKIECLTAPERDKQFFVKLLGQNFDPETARVLVVGPGCSGDEPCVVPNGAITLFGQITKSTIEKVPLTVSIGEYHLRVRNGIRGTSNELKITVPPE
jgi:DNA-binding winged helix-turn-helix (wHTH) protein